MVKPSKKRTAAKSVALVGIMAATVECGKLALMALPNVEVVTLLLGLFGYVFGWMGVLAAIIFVCIEPLLWGFNTWVISYFIYWPLVAFCFLLLGRLRVKNRFVFTGAAVLLTLFFGVLTSFVDVGLFTGYLDNLLYRFGIYYMRGIGFYAVQIACNTVLFLFAFPYLMPKLQGIKNKL